MESSRIELWKLMNFYSYENFSSPIRTMDISYDITQREIFKNQHTSYLRWTLFSYANCYLFPNVLQKHRNIQKNVRAQNQKKNYTLVSTLPLHFDCWMIELLTCNCSPPSSLPQPLPTLATYIIPALSKKNPSRLLFTSF